MTGQIGGRPLYIHIGYTVDFWFPVQFKPACMIFGVNFEWNNVHMDWFETENFGQLALVMASSISSLSWPSLPPSLPPSTHLGLQVV